MIPIFFPNDPKMLFTDLLMQRFGWVRRLRVDMNAHVSLGPELSDAIVEGFVFEFDFDLSDFV